MLKRIIFDLDFTLIKWKDEYPLLIKDILTEHNLDIDYKIIDDAIELQEEKYDCLSKEQILLDANANLDINISMDLLDEILQRQKVLSDYDEDTIKVLKYLSKKYEIVVLTNYFKEIQEGRLAHAGFMPYIKEVIGGDSIKHFKPHPDAFIAAMGPYNANECLVIGDSVRCDINGAKNVGIPAILFDTRKKYPDYQGKRINSLSELKEML